MSISVVLTLKSVDETLACVASVSVGFGSKERPRNGSFGVLPARKMGREPKKERGGWERGRKETLADKPLDFENLRSPANGARDWLGSPILLTCVDQKHFNTFECQTKGEDGFEAWLQNALTFLAERGFSRQIRQYGRNPVVQCRRFGFSKPAHYCRSKRDTICSCSFNFIIIFLNATCAKDKII